MERNLESEENPEIRAMMKRVTDHLIPYVHAASEDKDGESYMVMTDDKAPVELLGMKVIDEMIAEEVSYYKEIYDKDGLQGLLDAFSN